MIFKRKDTISFPINDSFAAKDSPDGGVNIQKGFIFNNKQDSKFRSKPSGFYIDFSGQTFPPEGIKDRKVISLRLDSGIVPTGVVFCDSDQSVDNEFENKSFGTINIDTQYAAPDSNIFIFRDSGFYGEFTSFITKNKSKSVLQIRNGKVNGDKIFEDDWFKLSSSDVGQKIFSISISNQAEGDANITVLQSDLLLDDLSFSNLQGVERGENPTEFNGIIPICIVDYQNKSVTNLLEGNLVLGHDTQYGINDLFYPNYA